MSQDNLVDPLKEELPHSSWDEDVSFGELLNQSSTESENEEIQWENISQKQEKNKIQKLEDVIELITEKNYEYVVFEPQENTVVLKFMDDSIEKELKTLSFSIYNSLLFKVKKQSWLILEENTIAQEWKWRIKIWKQEYELLSKTRSGEYGEKLWMKIKKMDIRMKKDRKTPLSVILWFIGAILFVGLVLWASFISFIIINAQNLNDVRFFANIGINLNEINAFILTIVTVVFSLLLFFFTSILSYSLFRFFLTKKIYKRKKIIFWTLSVLFLFITFGTGTSWMYLDAKVKNLPNWQEQAYGDLKILYNDLLIYSDFSQEEALLTDTNNLIWPVSLKFDLQNYQNKKSRQSIKIQKYIWSIGGNNYETFSPELIENFTRPGNYPITVEAIGTDIVGQEIRELIPNIPPISLEFTVEMTEQITPNGGKTVRLNAESLKSLWKVAWYFKSPLENKVNEYQDWEMVSEDYNFIPGKIFFEPIYIGLWVARWGKEVALEKIFVIQPQWNSEISADIISEPSLENELLYSFRVENAKTGFADGFIEEYIWTIWEKTYKVSWDITRPNISDTITHTFKNFWDQRVEVSLKDSRGNIKILSKNITIQKRVNLIGWLDIKNKDGTTLDNIRYEKETFEYYIDNLWVPTVLTFDARYVRPENILYTLKEVSWDIDANGNRDGLWTKFDFSIPTEWNHRLKVRYTFEHRRNKEDIIYLEENIYIESLKKEAIVNLEMEYESNYTPVTVRFDASKSFIRDDDIVKFIYDYGNGIQEERDAINPGHRYQNPWEYTITLTVVGSSGKQYKTQKKLVLLPPPQWVKISSSLKKAPVGQGIDFSSAWSQGQIAEFFWDFWDGNISSDANPSHSFKKAGRYNVILKVNFTNFNTQETSMIIDVFDENN